MKLLDELRAKIKVQTSRCGCRSCMEARGKTITYTVRCRECGWQDCPKAADHNNKCKEDTNVA